MANIRKRGDTYQIRVSNGYNDHGKQIVKSKTWKPAPGMTKRQIENELNRQAVWFEEEVTTGHIKPTNIKFEEFAEKWYTEYAPQNLKRSTYAIMGYMRPRVYSTIGQLKVDKITRNIVQRFVDDLHANGTSMRTGRKLSEKTVIHHLTFVSDVMEYAVMLDMIPANPCHGVKKPRVRVKEKRIYTMQEAARLLKLMETAPIKYKALVTLGIYSGLRRAELLGLEWRDIDMEHEVISVRRTSNHTIKDGNYTDTTKSEKSMRSLKLPTIVFGVLKELKLYNEAQKEKLGSKWVDSDLLFLKWNGEPMGINTSYEWLREFCEQNHIAFTGVHGLRHFNTSALINEGVDAVLASHALGHSAVSTTTNTYCHVFAEAQAKIGDAIASALDFDKYKERDSETIDNGQAHFQQKSN